MAPDVPAAASASRTVPTTGTDAGALPVDAPLPPSALPRANALTDSSSSAALQPRELGLRRWLETTSAYLPLLLMAALALSTLWLVKNTPLLEGSRVLAPVRHEPDYTMVQFTVQRFAANGTLRVQIEGDTLRHYPDTNTIEVDNPRIRNYGEDGRVTRASAGRAVANHDGSEIQLIGNAHIVREASARDAAIDFRGEFLHGFQYAERVRSHLPVVVTQGGTEVRGDSMVYDNLRGVVDLKGHLRAVFDSGS